MLEYFEVWPECDLFSLQITKRNKLGQITTKLEEKKKNIWLSNVVEIEVHVILLKAAF